MSAPKARHNHVKSKEQNRNIEMRTNLSNRLLWLKHFSYAGILSLRAEYLYGWGVATGCFVLFTAILWVLFSWNSNTWTINHTDFSERETVTLKSLLFAVLVLCYDAFLSSYSSVLLTLWCYLTFSRLYKGNWAIFKYKRESDTYLTLKKLLK